MGPAPGYYRCYGRGCHKRYYRQSYRRYNYNRVRASQRSPAQMLG